MRSCSCKSRSLSVSRHITSCITPSTLLQILLQFLPPSPKAGQKQNLLYSSVSRPAQNVVTVRVCWSAHPNRRSGALCAAALFSAVFPSRPPCGAFTFLSLPCASFAFPLPWACGCPAPGTCGLPFALPACATFARKRCSRWQCVGEDNLCFLS